MDDEAVVGTSSAIVGTEKWLTSPDAGSFSEPAMAAVKVESTWELITSFNGGNPDAVSYSCSRDGTTWKTRSTAAESNIDYTFPAPGGGAQPSFWADTSAVFRSGGSSYKAYIGSLSAKAGIGYLRWYRSTDPCPASGNPSWNIVDKDVAAEGIPGIDYPSTIYNEFNDTVWTVFQGQVNGHAVIAQGKLNDNGTFGWGSLDSCPGAAGPKGSMTASAAVDSAGIIHVIYRDDSNSQIKHISVSSTGGGFLCSTVSVVGTQTYSPPNANCAAATGARSFVGLGNNCLRDTGTSSIAIDKSVTPNVLVVAFQHYRTGAGCASPNTQTKIYRSTNGGQTWTLATTTGCLSAVQPRVTAVAQATLPGTSNRFHLTVSRVPQVGATTLSQYDYLSTNGGQSWTQVAMTSPRSVVPSGTYWGDYQGMTPDLSRSRIRFAWSQLDPNTGNWGIRGISDDQ